MIGQGEIPAVILADFSDICLLYADACRLHAPGTGNNAPMAQHHNCS